MVRNRHVWCAWLVRTGWPRPARHWRMLVADAGENDHRRRRAGILNCSIDWCPSRHKRQYHAHGSRIPLGCPGAQRNASKCD